MNAYQGMMLDNLVQELRVSNWLAAETEINLRPHPTAEHDALVQAHLDAAHFKVRSGI